MFRFLTVALVSLSTLFVQPQPAHAISGGVEFALPVIGTGSVVVAGSMSKGSLGTTVRASGWMFIVGGGLVLGADALYLLTVAAVLNASVRASSPEAYFRQSDESSAPITSVLNELEGDAILASALAADEGISSLGISSAARAVNVPTKVLAEALIRAKYFGDRVQGSRFGTEVKQVSASQMSALVPAAAAAKTPIVEAILKNYLSLRNVRTI